MRIEISACFLVNFQFRAEVKKVMSQAKLSQAENPSAPAMAQASSAQAHHYYLANRL